MKISEARYGLSEIEDFCATHAEFKYTILQRLFELCPTIVVQDSENKNTVIRDRWYNPNITDESNLEVIVKKDFVAIPLDLINKVVQLNLDHVDGLITPGINLLIITNAESKDDMLAITDAKSKDDLLAITNTKSEDDVLAITNKKEEEQTMEPLVVKFWRRKNLVVAEIIQQDEDIIQRGNFCFIHNGYEIHSVSKPEIWPNHKLYIRGTSIERDEEPFCHSFAESEEAKMFIENISKTIKAFNLTYKEEYREEEEEEEGDFECFEAR